MKSLETGKDKVKKICDVLRRETLEPAQHEASVMIEKARERAEDMIVEAQEAIERMYADARQEIERQRNVFQSSLSQACKQTLEVLKQNIEEKLFNQELGRMITKQTLHANVLAELITAIVQAVEKGGVEADLSAYIPAAVPAKSVNELLAHNIIDKLKEKSVLVGPQTGGVEVKLHQQNITLDISDAAIKELVGGYIRKDFRAMLFGPI